MKLIRFGKKGSEKPGIEIKNIRYDCSEYFHDWDRDFFDNDGMKKLAKIVKKKKLPIVSNKKRLGSPIARPGMIMCIGLNYSDHALESGMDLPSEPIIFMKASNTLSGPFDPVKLPPGSTKVDWEVELGIVIGQTCYQLADSIQANDCIAGFTIVHDVSERHLQLERGGQWTKGKSCPGFSPTGPYLVPKNKIDNVNNLDMWLKLNGIKMQRGNTNKMIFNPDHIVHYLSQFMTLEAGDLISTGTPPGVGLGMNPPQYIAENDVVELKIQKLGRQKHRFIR